MIRLMPDAASIVGRAAPRPDTPNDNTPNELDARFRIGKGAPMSSLRTAPPDSETDRELGYGRRFRIRS